MVDSHIGDDPGSPLKPVMFEELPGDALPKFLVNPDIIRPDAPQRLLQGGPVKTEAPHIASGGRQEMNGQGGAGGIEVAAGEPAGGMIDPGHGKLFRGNHVARQIVIPGHDLRHPK